MSYPVEGLQLRKEAIMAYEWNCREECDKEPVVIAIGESGRMYALDAGCAIEPLQEETMMYRSGGILDFAEEKVTFYGTHILSETARAELKLTEL